MSFLGLFGKPNGQKVNQRGDNQGLFKAMGYQGDWRIGLNSAQVLYNRSRTSNNVDSHVSIWKVMVTQVLNGEYDSQVLGVFEEGIPFHRDRLPELPPSEASILAISAFLDYPNAMVKGLAGSILGNISHI